MLSAWWLFRILLVVVAVLGLALSFAGCAPVTVRVRCVHLSPEPTADVCIRVAEREICASVQVESVVREVPDKPEE